MVKNAKHPMDWGLITIKEICKSLNYGTSKKSTFSGKCAVLRMGNLQNGYIDWTDLVYTNDEKDIQKYSLVKGDVLFNRTNSADLVGKTSLYRGEYPAIYAGYLIKLNYDRKKVVGEYLNYILNTQEAKEYCLAVKTDGVSQSNINAQKIGAFLFHLPPFEEQEKISEVLSDVDNLIFSLQKLIEKKQAIKQGAMQELLTGEKRLPGFCGVWKKKCLCDLAADIKTGTKNNEDKVKGGKYPFFVRSATVEKINSYSYDCEAILVPGEGNIGEIFHYINGKFDCHQRVYKISDFRECIGLYIFYYLKMFFGAYALLNTVKATVDSLRLPTFQNFIIHVPNDLKEQQAIAQVLSDMDSEIEQLEKKLSKYQQIKQGMMQELLTGRIRLV